MSGTAFGTIILHVTPDAASGGPLGLIRSGDRITVNGTTGVVTLAGDSGA